MSIQDRARLIAQFIAADEETRRLILDQAAGVDAVTPLGPRLVDELLGLRLPAAA
jgi:hypothetical protein